MEPIDEIALSERVYPAERHSHAHDHAQALFPDRGALHLELAGAGGAVRAGTLGLVTPGAEHAFWAAGPNRCLVVDIPARVYDELAPRGALQPFRPMDARLGAVATALRVELETGGAADPLVAGSLGLYAATAVLRGPDGAPARPAPIGARRIAGLAEAYLRAHALEPISVAEVAAAAGASPAHLQRCFRAELGCTVLAYAQRRRLDAAKAMLVESDLSLLEIAGRVGFASQSHLSRLFAREVGCSPSVYRALSRSRTGMR